LDLIAADIVNRLLVAFNIQYAEKINGLRNRLAEEGHSKAGEKVWVGQPIRRGFESAISFIVK